MIPTSLQGTYRYGVIGTGMMGQEHIVNVTGIPNAEVVAVADPVPQSVTEALALAPEADGYADYQDLLDRDDVDVVVLASPNYTHIDILGDMIDSGKHLLVEKPLCTTVDDCQRVIEQAKGATQQIMVALEYRYMPPVARLVEEVRNGSVGTAKMVAMREHRFPFLPKVGDWNRFSRNTGGTLVEKCCHFFDLMNLILEERPYRVMASGAQDVNHLNEEYNGERPDILDNAFVILDYPSGARASLDLCMFAEATHNQEEVSVIGDKGKVEALIPEGVIRRGTRGVHRIGQVETEVVSTDHIAVEGLHHGASYLEHLELLTSIEQGRPPVIGLEEGLWSVAAGVAAHRSIEEGRPVELKEVL